jgi:hypothetical protein
MSPTPRLLRLLPLAWLCALLLVARVAPAQDAAALKAEGDTLMETFKYSEALDRYERAYAASSDPALLYNQGRALELMARFPEALEKLRAFDAKAPPELHAKVPNLGKLLDEIESKTCVLTVRVAQAGATIQVGSVVLGKSPMPERRVNAARSAHLEVTLDGYDPMTKDVELPGMGDVKIDVDLVPRDKMATLRITSPVAGARVSVDGKPLGGVPSEIRLEPGTHQVHLEAEGYRDNTVEVVLGKAERRELEIGAGEAPVYETWWFWTITGTVLAGGGATGLAIALTTEGDPDVGTIAPGTSTAGRRAQATERARPGPARRDFQIGPIPVLTVEF